MLLIINNNRLEKCLSLCAARLCIGLPHQKNAHHRYQCLVLQLHLHNPHPSPHHCCYHIFHLVPQIQKSSCVCQTSNVHFHVDLKSDLLVSNREFFFFAVCDSDLLLFFWLSPDSRVCFFFLWLPAPIVIEGTLTFPRRISWNELTKNFYFCSRCFSSSFTNHLLALDLTTFRHAVVFNRQKTRLAAQIWECITYYLPFLPLGFGFSTVEPERFRLAAATAGTPRFSLTAANVKFLASDVFFFHAKRERYVSW